MTTFHASDNKSKHYSVGTLNCIFMKSYPIKFKHRLSFEFLWLLPTVLLYVRRFDNGFEYSFIIEFKIFFYSFAFCYFYKPYDNTSD